MKSMTLAGIDVSAKELVVCSQVKGGTERMSTFENTPAGHQKLIKFLTKQGRHAHVCVEATGVYHFGLAMKLFASPKTQVAVVNPRGMKHYADAVLQRAKTDTVDAKLILDYLNRMPFVSWEPPAQIFLQLQSISRRMLQLTNQQIQEKNRRHAEEYKHDMGGIIQRDIEVNIRHFEKRLALMQENALKLIESDVDLKRKFDLLNSVKGIGKVSAIKLLGELMCLPKDMQPEQWVAHAGLDPKPGESGSSVNKKRRISRFGNKYLRTSLYMPALVAIKNDPHVKAFRNKLVNAGKGKMQAIVAVMRKLLRCIWGMFKNDAQWSGEMFYSGELDKKAA